MMPGVTTFQVVEAWLKPGAVTVTVEEPVVPSTPCTWNGTEPLPSATFTLIEAVPGVEASGATSRVAGLELVTVTITPPWLATPRLAPEPTWSAAPNVPPDSEMPGVGVTVTNSESETMLAAVARTYVEQLGVVVPPQVRGSNGSPVRPES